MLISKADHNLSLNHHIRREAFRRLWKLYILFLVMGLFMGGMFVVLMTAGAQDIEQAFAQMVGPSAAGLFFRPKMSVLLVPPILAVMLPFLGFVASGVLAELERPVYRVYAVLPLALAERGRRIWLRQAVAAPGIVGFKKRGLARFFWQFRKSVPVPAFCGLRLHASQHQSILKQAILRHSRRVKSKMLIRQRRRNTALMRPLDKPDLDQVRLVNFLERLRLFPNRHRQ